MPVFSGAQNKRWSCREDSATWFRGSSRSDGAWSVSGKQEGSLEPLAAPVDESQHRQDFEVKLCNHQWIASLLVKNSSLPTIGPRGD